MMALTTAPLLCLFTIASDIFTLKKDTTKTHYNNARLNVPDNALATTPGSMSQTMHP
jgi:hypothetical protein